MKRYRLRDIHSNHILRTVVMTPEQLRAAIAVTPAYQVWEPYSY